MGIRVREPAVSGQFYPSERKQLAQTLKRFLQEVPFREIEAVPKALIVPHAGFIYSGEVAAYGFSLLKEAGKQWKKVVAIGPAHAALIDELAADVNDYWKTPLGKVKVHHNGFPELAAAHRNEHSLEVELPFLQYLLGEFEWMPLVAGNIDPKTCAQSVMETLDDDTLLLVSSDLSHFYHYERANLLDRRTIEAIEALDYEEMEKIGIACGKAPILIAMRIARQKGWQCRLLKYLNSGDITGDHSSVVCYASFVFF